MIVKVFLTLDIDEDDYPMPADGADTEESRRAHYTS